uniref:Uncharacterized protein n=1 Tax=Parascaris univalens TaxID=6257 RepID=A0A915C677_PARUN
MNVFSYENSQQQVEWHELSASPVALTIPSTWPMNLLIFTAAALSLAALFFLISHALRYIYRRRLNERMNHHLGRFSPRNPVVISMPKRSHCNAAAVYVVPASLMKTPPSYHQFDTDWYATSTDKNMRACK